MPTNRFRIALAALLVGAFALTLANPAAAFLRLTRQDVAPGSPVVQAHWLDSALPLLSVIDPTNADIPRATALATIQASAQTWQDIKQLQSRYDLDLTIMEPLVEPDELWKVDPTECCTLRKVEPLARALQ